VPEPLSTWGLLAILYGGFAALGIPFAVFGRNSPTVAKFSFGSLAFLRETGLPGGSIGFIMILPFLLTPVVAAFLLLAMGVRDPHAESDLS